MIIVKPKGGLGNRLRVIHSVLSIQLVEPIPIHIIWDRNRSLNCKFQDLFENNHAFTFENSMPDFVNRILKKIKFEYFFKSANRNSYERELFDNEIIKLRNRGYNFELLAKHRSVYIETCEWFYTHKSGQFLYPQARIKIKNRVDSIAKEFSDNTVGVHIRMGDHTLAKKHSPLRLFTKFTDEFLQKFNNVKIFLSTDSPDVEKFFIANYSDHIITQTGKLFGRESSSAVVDSFVDMLCLSRTNKIYGSSHSTFSGIAAEIGGIEKVTLKVKDL